MQTAEDIVTQGNLPHSDAEPSGSVRLNGYTPKQAKLKRRWALEVLEYYHAQWLEVERDERMSHAVQVLLGFC